MRVKSVNKIGLFKLRFGDSNRSGRPVVDSGAQEKRAPPPPRVKRENKIEESWADSYFLVSACYRLYGLQRSSPRLPSAIIGQKIFGRKVNKS